MTARKVEHDAELIDKLLITGLCARGSMRYALRQYHETQAQPLLDEIAEKDNRIASLEYAAKAVIRRGLIHDYIDDDEFESVIKDLEGVLGGEG